MVRSCGENGRTDKRVYIVEFAGSRSEGKPLKRWIDTVNDCLRKRGLDVRQARRMVQDRSEWWGFIREKWMGRSTGDEPLSLARCHSFMKPLSGILSVVVNGKFLSLFSFLSFVSLLLLLIFMA